MPYVNSNLKASFQKYSLLNFFIYLLNLFNLANCKDTKNHFKRARKFYKIYKELIKIALESERLKEFDKKLWQKYTKVTKLRHKIFFVQKEF